MDNTRKMIEELLRKVPKEKVAEIVRAASEAKTAADIRAIGKAHGVEVTDGQAELLLRLYSEEAELPVEYLDMAGAKIRGEAYKIANEDGLAAKWLADYNQQMENFKIWAASRNERFGE